MRNNFNSMTKLAKAEIINLDVNHNSRDFSFFVSYDDAPLDIRM